MLIHRRMNKQTIIFWILNTPLTSLCFSSQLPLFFSPLKAIYIPGNICSHKFLSFHLFKKPLNETFLPIAMEIQLEDDPHIVDSVISSQLPTYLTCGHHLAELITPLCKHLIHLDSRSSHYPDVPPTSLICSSLYLLCLHPLLSHFFMLDGSREPSVLGALPYLHSWPFIWFHAFKYCLRILWQLLYKILLPGAPGWHSC